jgi:hypothetical protein
MPRDSAIDKVLILGSGPIISGQGCEFDYSGTQACTLCSTSCGAVPDRLIPA